jgi:thermostable 8-oxoguanine DNA glycosylase
VEADEEDVRHGSTRSLETTASPGRLAWPCLREFELQFSADQIRALAARFEYEDDERVRAAGEAARLRGCYRRDEFLLVCAWKTARSRSKVAGNTDAEVERATRTALEAQDEAQRMEALLELEGVGVPTASTLLHFAYPTDYPILDVRALESLGHQGRNTYSLSYWLSYLDACRRLAREHGVTLRVLDKALWQHSKERGR